jgi:hypothetical protein
MHIFNFSNAGYVGFFFVPPLVVFTLSISHTRARALFVEECKNMTLLGFDGCFIDSASSAKGNLLAPHLSKKLIAAGVDAAILRDQAVGQASLLSELQAAVGSGKLIIPKDGGGVYDDSQYVNSLFLSDAYCSSYSAPWSSRLGQACSEQIAAAKDAGAKGQAVLMHGEANNGNTKRGGDPEDNFNFTLAAFLVAAENASFFGYSDGWYVRAV